MDCPRCRELEHEIDSIRVQLVDAGRPAETIVVDTSAACEEALAAWLSRHPRGTAREGWHAGWAALARYRAPMLHEWQQRWWDVRTEVSVLRSRIGTLLSEISRLSDSG